jgi:thiosulfate dehydrogenase (quinone) large subunit
MTDVFGLLSVHKWLAILRIALGLWWIKSVLHKPLRKFVGGQMINWSLSLADNHPVKPFGKAIRGLLEPNASWFPYFLLAVEAAVGLGLVFGIVTPITLLVAIFLNLNYLALAGVKPLDRTVNAAYQCEQGQNFVMIASQVVLFFLGAGAVWSLDALIGIF